MIVIFEGQDKAGKTTLIDALEKSLQEAGYTVHRRKFSGPMQSELDYLIPLLRDENDPMTIHIYDRGWVSEYVYATLLNRESTLKGEEGARAERIFSSIVDRGYGVKIIVAPLDIDELIPLRDYTDMPTDPYQELDLFTNYAVHWGWVIVPTEYNYYNLKWNCSWLLKRITQQYEALKRKTNEQNIR